MGPCEQAAVELVGQASVPPALALALMIPKERRCFQDIKWGVREEK